MKREPLPSKPPVADGFAQSAALLELKKQTAMMAQKRASQMAAGGLIIGIPLGLFLGPIGVIGVPIVLAWLLYSTTYKNLTRD